MKNSLELERATVGKSSKNFLITNKKSKKSSVMNIVDNVSVL